MDKESSLMRIVVADDVDLFLSPVELSDVDAFVRMLGGDDVGYEDSIQRNLLVIPFPYGRSDAEWFAAHCVDVREKEEKKRPLNWMIRKVSENNKAIGSIGLMNTFATAPMAKKHCDEFGYYLDKNYWGKGIMKQVLKSFVPIAMKEFNLHRLEAAVFSENIRSQGALLGSGFEYEGRKRKAYFKDGQFLDGLLYSFTL